MKTFKPDEDIEVDYDNGGPVDFKVEFSSKQNPLTVEFDSDGPLLITSSDRGPEEEEIIPVTYAEIPRIIDMLRAIDLAHRQHAAYVATLDKACGTGDGT